MDYTQEDIDALSARIDELSVLVKRDLLRQAGYEERDVDLALEYVRGTSEQEIRESIRTLGDELPVLVRVAMKQQRTTGVDPPGMGYNGPRMRPRRIDFDEIGTEMFERVKDKTRNNGASASGVGALDPSEFAEKPKVKRYR
ncbi:hypothetical protein ACQKLN_11030 [Paenibacillus glucanolyticus]|uniref:hypothetical protein n=1 Tax=Paenibacillus glucanolyticus TaxID=59843 RepID=UPI0034CDF8B0